MLKDIVWTDTYEITMHKVLFSDNEMSLARCLSFRIDIDTMEIVCDLTVTTKIAILEFIRETFQRVWSNPSEAIFKEQLLGDIDDRYADMYKLFEEQMLPKLGYQDKLYQHQKDSLFMAFNKQHNLFALEQGLGKSNIAGSLSKMMSFKRTLIVCPASLKWTWMKDLCGPVSGFNELYFSILDSNKSRTIKAFQERFVICNFDSLEKHMGHILSSPLHHIIIDECTAIKSTSTIRYKKCDEIIKANPQAKVSLLSGTPLRNRCVDFFAYLKIVGHPLGSNYAAFVREYAIASKGRGPYMKISGAKNTAQLWRNTSNFTIRKRKDECLDLPAKIYSKLHFNLNDYKSEYDKAVLDALEKSGNTNLNSCIHTINRVTSKAKLSGVIEFIESIVDQEEKVVVFSTYTDIILALQEHFISKCVMINGSVDSKERSNRVDKFMQDEKCMVFIGQTLAAGTGLTLTSASNMVFCDLPFSPADLVQAEDRCHRIGTTKPVNIYYASCDDSIDEHIYDLIVSKAHDASKIIDNKLSDIVSGEKLSELLISDLRKKYNIPVVISE